MGNGSNSKRKEKFTNLKERDMFKNICLWDLYIYILSTTQIFVVLVLLQKVCQFWTKSTKIAPVHLQTQFSYVYRLLNCSVTCDRSVVFSGYSSFLHQQNWPPRYNWNIVESGIKHHKPKPQFQKHWDIVTWNFHSSRDYLLMCAC
jgi:hypothetical protein